MWRALLLSVTALAAAQDQPPPAPYAFNTIMRERIDMSNTLYYSTTIPQDAPAIKISIVPLFGDADVFISFEPFTDAEDSQFRMENPGMEEMLLRRDAYEWTCKELTCALHFAIFGYSTSEFLFRVSPFDDPTVQDPMDVECAPGCTHFELTDAECHLECNTTACMYDGGDCLLEEEYCSRGCPNQWIGDELCDEACFTPECNWDTKVGASPDEITAPCFEGSDERVGCAPKCLPRWLDDGQCDAECNNAACGWDGSDCFHGHDECWYEKNGTDYRGTVNKTKSGRTCQFWSEQYPHQHTRTSHWYPLSGLGGHNYCRNPDNEAGPWCYTTDPTVRWELCDVPSTAGTPACPAKLPQPDFAAGETALQANGECPENSFQRRTGICAPCTQCAEGMEERIKCSTAYDRICAPACAISLGTRFDSQGKGALAMVQALCAYDSYNHSSYASFDAKRLCSSYCCHAFELAAGACDYDGAHLDTWNDIKKNLVIGHESLCKTLVDTCPVFADARARGDKSEAGAGGSTSGRRGGGSSGRSGGSFSPGGSADVVTTSEAISNPLIMTMLTVGGAAVVVLCLALMWYRRRVKQTLLYASPNAPDQEEMQEAPQLQPH